MKMLVSGILNCHYFCKAPYIAKAATQFEPEQPLWRQLLELLPEAREPVSGVLPHPTRFVSMTGFTRSGPGRVTVWIRPRPDLAFANG